MSHNTKIKALTNRELQTLRNLGNECEDAVDEIMWLRAALIQSAATEPQQPINAQTINDDLGTAAGIARTMAEDQPQPTARAPVAPTEPAGGEAVGEVYTMEAIDSLSFDGGWPRCHVSLYKDLPAGTRLYTSPQPHGAGAPPKPESATPAAVAWRAWDKGLGCWIYYETYPRHEPGVIESLIPPTTPAAVQAVEAEPEFFTVFSQHGEGFVPLPGYSNETVKGVKDMVLTDARREGYKGTVSGRLLDLGWVIRPVYATPQVVAALPVQALVQRLSEARIDEIFDAHQEAPTMSYRYLVARAIEAALAVPQEVEQAREATTAKDDGIVLSVKRDEWEALSHEAQATLESIVWKGAIAYRRQQAEGRERIINAPLLGGQVAGEEK